MKKTPSLLVALTLLCATLAAQPRWQQVALFDWVYPSEQAYADLKQGAIQAQSQGWVVEKIRKGETLPQASARELAWSLQKNAAVDPALKAKLKAEFDDEAVMLGADEGNSLTAKRAQDVSGSLDRSTQAMDALEASMKANHYGKGSTPALNIDFYDGYRLDAPAGMAILDNHGYLIGGLNATLLGTIDKINFTLGIGMDWTNISGAAIDDYEYKRGLTSIGASFQIPLGNGGLDVSLGDLADLYLSPLLFASILPINRDGFFVDVTAAYRPPKAIKTMELGYPAGTRGARGVVVKRQGTMAWWPFTKTQFVYTPSSLDYWQSWEQRLNVWTARLDEDLGPRGRWLDGVLFYGLAGGSYNDEDLQLAPGGLPKLPQSTTDYSLGTDLRFGSGTTLRFDAASSSFTLKAPTYTQTLQGNAYIGTLVQPVGPFYLALEGGAADPDFVSKPSLNDRLQSGATYDTAASIGGDTHYTFGAVPAKPAYISLIRDPTVLSNNSQRATLKGEWHGSFVAVGLYDGVIDQVAATGPYVMTSPYLEGSSANGYGWFKVFGQTYGMPPDPLVVVSPGSGGPYYQMLYNKPTDSTPATPALTPLGPKQVHWQQISQLGYQETEFTLLLSQKGVGDRTVMADSVKALNYAGANVQFDLASLFNRTLPLGLDLVGEVRDLALQAGAPALDDSGLFNQQIANAFLNVGITETVNFLAMAGYETWKSKQSYYPLNIQTREFGIGADMNLDPLVSGLKMNFRGSVLDHVDLNLPSRQFSLLTISIGSTLSY